MRFRFAEVKLEELYTRGRGGKRYSKQVLDAFLRAIATIDAAADERDLYAQKGLHFEKLKGDRKGQRSIRLNQQWRLERFAPISSASDANELCSTLDKEVDAGLLDGFS